MQLTVKFKLQIVIGYFWVWLQSDSWPRTHFSFLAALNKEDKTMAQTGEEATKEGTKWKKKVKCGQSKAV